MTTRLLIVEDHRAIVQNIRDYLDEAAYAIDDATRGEDALALARQHPYDVVLLDINLPGMDGLKVCRALCRDLGLDTPVLMLTARDTLPDKLEGFRAGTDDYLTKPFDLEELEARLEVLARRGGARDEAPLEVGEVSLHPGTRNVTRRGRPVAVSPTGYRILLTLMKAHPNVVTREQMEQAIWGSQPPGSDALRTHMASLRKAIDKPFAAPLIETLYGVGFRLLVTDAETTP